MLIRNLFAASCLILALACSGGAHSSDGAAGAPGGGSGGPPPPPPPTSAPFPRVTLQGAPTGPLAPSVTPTGTVVPTMIVTDQGIFYYETADFQQAKGALLVDSTGQLHLNGTCVVTAPDGTTQPFTMTGSVSQDGKTISGTATTGTFTLQITTLQSIAINLSAVAGNYISTSVSTGRVTYLTLKADGTFVGQDYNSPADYPQYFAGQYTGSLQQLDPVKNALNAGANYQPSGAPSPLPSTYGYAMFDGSGNLLLFTANPNGDPKDTQFSGVFAKQ